MLTYDFKNKASPPLRTGKVPTVCFQGAAEGIIHTTDHVCQRCVWDFPAGPVAENLPANAGGTISAPGPGRFHTPPQGNEAGTATAEARGPGATLCGRSHSKGKPSRGH